MNRITCDVCQQQFKTTSGLTWHLDRIHDHRIEHEQKEDLNSLDSETRVDRSYAEEAPDEQGLNETVLDNRCAEMVDNYDLGFLRIVPALPDQSELARRLSEVENALPSTAALSAECSRLTVQEAKTAELVQATSTLIWALDRSNRGSTNLADALTGLIAGPAELDKAREILRAGLRRQIAEITSCRCEPTSNF